MKKTLSLFALCLILPSLYAGQVLAKTYPDGGVTGEDIVADLKAGGYKASLGKDDNGNPMIDASFLAGTTDIDYRVFFYDCKSGRCGSIQFFIGFDGDTSKIGEWNATRRFARAYTPGDKKIRVEYDVDVERGANSEAIKNAADRFKALVIASVRFMG